MLKDKIFIQIASYRDPELIHTIDDCIKNSKYPDNLIFCIAHQFNDEEEFSKDIDKYRNDSRFKIIDIPYKESKGACWARNTIQQKYDDEEYTLQLDSHHRFIENWDEELINMIKHLQNKGHKKPLLTSYISAYHPDNDPEGRTMVPWWMTFDRFIPEGAVFFLPAEIPGWQELTEPIPARFYSAHFCFTLGQFAKEVQHDPNMYFHGEEISIAVRAYTHGYDLFHPHKIVAWHEYTRNGRVKHWDDDNEWGTKNDISHARNRALLGMDGECSPCMKNSLGIYFLGEERTLKDYEKYAGISFRRRAVQQYTLSHNFPPNPVIDDPEEYEKSFTSIFKHCINVHKNSFIYDDYDFCAVIFEDERGYQMNRIDLTGNELLNLINTSQDFINIWREFNTTHKPTKWIVWPHSVSQGWCERLEGGL